MKTIKIILIAFFTVSILFACKKKDTTPAPTVVGFWKGLYGSGTDTPATPYALLFRGNGTVRAFASNTDTTLAQKAEGTYNVSGTSLQITYTYLPPSSNTISATSTATATFATMTGTWGFETNRTNGGTFNLTKQ